MPEYLGALACRHLFVHLYAYACMHVCSCLCVSTCMKAKLQSNLKKSTHECMQNAEIRSGVCVYVLGNGKNK